MGTPPGPGPLSRYFLNRAGFRNIGGRLYILTNLPHNHLHECQDSRKETTAEPKCYKNRDFLAETFQVLLEPAHDSEKVFVSFSVLGAPGAKMAPKPSPRVPGGALVFHLGCVWYLF